MEVQRCKILLTPDPTRTFRRVVEKTGTEDLRVNVLVGGMTTLPEVAA